MARDHSIPVESDETPKDPETSGGSKEKTVGFAARTCAGTLDSTARSAGSGRNFFSVPSSAWDGTAAKLCFAGQNRPEKSNVFAKEAKQSFAAVRSQAELGTEEKCLAPHFNAINTTG